MRSRLNGICLKAVSYHLPLLAPVEPFAVDLHWTVQQPVADDFILFIHLLDDDGQSVSGVNAYPLEHAYRTYEWQPGETIISSTKLDVPASFAPAAYSFELGMFLAYDFESVPNIGADKEVNGDRILFGPVKVRRPAIKLPADSVPVKIMLAGELELIGYRVDALPAVSRPLQLTVWWRGVRPAAKDWTPFSHLTPVSDERELLGQMD